MSTCCVLNPIKHHVSTVYYFKALLMMVAMMIDWLLSSTEAHLGTATLHIHVEVGVVTVSYEIGRELTQDKGNTGNPKSYKPQEKK